MKTKQHLIPKQFKKIRPQIHMNPRYITVHETGNTNKGANANAHARLLERGNTRVASWHYTVDEIEIVQHVPDNEVAWHCGDGGKGKGNRESIGIEICVNKDGDFTKAKRNAITLIQSLMKKHAIPISRVVPHKHWSGKNCPEQLLKKWDEFIKGVQIVKLPYVIRVMVDGQVALDSRRPGRLWGVIRKNLGREIIVRPRRS